MSDQTGQSPKVTADYLGALVLMLASEDTTERDIAARALKDTPPESITPVLSDGSLRYEVIRFFAEHVGERRDWIKALLENPSLLDEDKAVLTAASAVLGPAPPPGAEEEDDEDLSIGQRIAKMRVGEKIKMAMKGDKEARTILIKDTNREVYLAVLNNPGMKEAEVEMMVKNTGTSADILRVIAKNREWVSNRNIMSGLILNPKTPPELSIRFLARLGVKELEKIEKSRGLPSAVRTNAKRILSQKRKGG
jgi:hypothetical protein